MYNKKRCCSMSDIWSQEIDNDRGDEKNTSHINFSPTF